MEAGTFPEQQFIDYLNRHFVPVKFVSGADADQFFRFDIRGEPAFLVLTQDGDEVYRKIGYFEASLLIEQLDKARKKAAHRALKE